MLGDGELNFEPTYGGVAMTGAISRQATTRMSSSDYASIWHGGFPEERSLFAELGIHNTDVANNLKVILLPMSRVQTVDDNFIVRMLFFFLFAAALLILGKVRFGMVYMIGLLGFVILYYLFKFMATEPRGITVAHLFTALSYCTISLIPLVLLVGLLRLGAKATTVLATPFIGWSAFSATRYVMTQLILEEIRPLVFIPLCLFYTFLLLLPIY
jgi:hypothetical protein